MCFVDKEGYRFITSRKFLYLTTNRCFSFVKKEYDRRLSISIVYDDGEFHIKFVNVDSGETEELSNPKSGDYSFALEKGKKYRLIILSKKACGSYKLRMKSFK